MIYVVSFRKFCQLQLSGKKNAAIVLTHGGHFLILNLHK